MNRKNLFACFQILALLALASGVLAEENVFKAKGTDSVGPTYEIYASQTTSEQRLRVTQASIPTQGDNGQTTQANANDAQEPAVFTRFTWSEADGKGDRYPLADGSELPSGARFRVYMQANRALYVYVYHTDCREHVELIQWSGYSNLLQAGQYLELPKQDEVFALDQTAGTEYFHTVFSDSPLDLAAMAAQDSHCGGIAMVPKGIVKTKLHKGDGPARKTVQVKCPAAASMCRQTFKINHVAS